MANGTTISWKALEYSRGQMERTTPDNIKMTKKMGKVLKSGQMEENISALGKMENNMVKGY